jgi:BMFP domain-containing protein YqiC
MQTQNRILDDLAKLVTNAAGAAQGVKAEIDTLFRQRAEKLLAELDLVTREEFEAVQAMAAAARTENARLEEMLTDLTKRLEKLETKPRATRKKPAKSEMPAKESKRAPDDEAGSA